VLTPRSLPRFVLASLLVACLAPTSAILAAKGDCGQPLSNGPKPLAGDCLACLRCAVGNCIPEIDPPCICDTDGNGSTSASDALRCLRYAVGQTVLFDCMCPDEGGLPCTSAEIFTLPGSDLDSGWTGIAHNSELIEGASITFRGVRRCSDDQSVCERDSDCEGAATCDLTCNCNGGDTECEITGPTHGKNCVTNLAECETNADCPTAVACVHTFGPPLPLSSGGNPVCVLTLFDGAITGTADSATGEGVAAVNLRSRVFLGIGIDQPCPRCGEVGEDPEVGDQFTCDGGQFPGAPCIVEGVNPNFGGTSRDCPPSLGASISGSGLAIRFSQVTTGLTTKTAQLPCSDGSFLGHPTRNNAKCIDKTAIGDPLCTSNADCRRCTGNITIACSDNGDCSGNGTCAEAPDQPVTCGYWCHCGFCNNNPLLPCFENGDCPNGQTCVAGTGNGTQQNSPQKKPNDCISDKFICGGADDEKCENTLQGTCELESFRACTENSTCQNQGAGDCVFDFRPCFEPTITRQGSGSPLGSYCRSGDDKSTCASNADCDPGVECVADASRPTTVALFCVPATTSSTINSAGGITGPGAVRFESFIKVCRCGDGKIECDEECEDGNTISGDGCDSGCRQE